MKERLKHLKCRLGGGHYYMEMPRSEYIRIFQCTCGKIVMEDTRNNERI